MDNNNEDILLEKFYEKNPIFSLANTATIQLYLDRVDDKDCLFISYSFISSPTDVHTLSSYSIFTEEQIEELDNKIVKFADTYYLCTFEEAEVMLKRV